MPPSVDLAGTQLGLRALRRLCLSFKRVRHLAEHGADTEAESWSDLKT